MRNDYSQIKGQIIFFSCISEEYFQNTINNSDSVCGKIFDNRTRK